MVGLIGKKLGHTRIYDTDGKIVPVTIVLAGPNRVVQCKTVEKDGYSAVQLGFDDQKEARINKALAGHFLKCKAAPVKRLREFRDFSIKVKEGDTLNVDIFSLGDYVDCIGITKGHGFEGVVKRYGFHGGTATHGCKGWKRRTGALGCRLFPGTVSRGTKEPGHMGQVRRTVQNLKIAGVMPEDNIILIRGSMPGSEGDYVIIRESKKKPKAKATAKK